MYVLRHIYYIIFTLNVATSQQDTYYKIVKISGKRGCVEAVVTQKVASRFGAMKGSCSEQQCHIYRGKRYIPFCCSIKGFGCE